MQAMICCAGIWGGFLDGWGEGKGEGRLIGGRGEKGDYWEGAGKVSEVFEGQVRKGSFWGRG